MNTNCAECGLLHPYTPPGKCPVANGNKLDEEANTLNDEKSVRMCQAIQKKLIEKMKNLSNESAHDLSMKVYKLIEGY